MPKRKGSKKFYQVLSKDKNYCYGAFPFTKEGELKAKAYIRSFGKTKGKDLYIKAK
jgi:hypothetical protein